MMLRCSTLFLLMLVSIGPSSHNAIAQPPGFHHHPSPPSGMLLGIYAFPNYHGLRVVSTIPGYSAEGRLFRNDVLLRVSDGTRIYRIRSLPDLEHAKDRIGPYRSAAIEFHRPHIGLTYAWVEFRPVGGGVYGRAASQAYLMTEEERPGAREFFHGGRQATENPPDPSRPPQTSSDDPASFFNP